MIDAVIYYRGNKHAGFFLRGHAEYAQPGEDIVCAAASVLAINTVNSIEKIAKDEVTVNEIEKDGIIDCKLSENPKELSMAFIESFELGIKEVEAQYGDFVKVTSKEI